MSSVAAVKGGVTIRVKAVPGAKREQISGVLGDRLKVKVTAPPEGGKANAAICALIADALGIKKNDVAVVSGGTNPEKVVEAMGVTAEEAARLLGIS